MMNSGGGGGRHRGEEDFVESLLRDQNRMQWLLFNSKVMSDQQLPDGQPYPPLNKEHYFTYFSTFYQSGPQIRRSCNQIYTDLCQIGFFPQLS